MRLNSLVVQRVPIDSVRLPGLAVLQNPKKQIEKAQKLIARFGQIPAVLAEPNGEILFWEEVWLALKADGATHVDVMFVNHMSPAELKAIRLALHRTQLDAKFNDQNVRIVLEELASIDFDLDLTGFDPPEIDGYLNLICRKRMSRRAAKTSLLSRASRLAAGFDLGIEITAWAAVTH